MSFEQPYSLAQAWKKVEVWWHCKSVKGSNIYDLCSGTGEHWVYGWLLDTGEGGGAFYTLLFDLYHVSL